MKQRYVSFIRLAVIAAVLSSALFACTKLAATSSSPWFLSAPPEFATIKPALSDEEYPTTYSQRGNVDCDALSFTKRDGDLLPFLPLHKESIQTGCYIQTSSGALDPNGYLNVSGSDYIAEVVKSDNTPTSFFAFPSSDTFISNASGSAANGAYVWFGSLKNALKLENDHFGRIRAKLNASMIQTPLTDHAGNKLAVMADNFGVSENGQWAVVDSPGRALLRIDLATMEVVPFAPSLEYGNGIGASIRTHISGDGRYIVVASKNYTYFKLYDLSTCAATLAVITSPVACTSRDMHSFIQSKIPGFTSILQLRFQTGNLLKIYASHTENNVSGIGEYMLAAPGTSLKGMDYLALGDSFSSGEGAHNYEIGTDEHSFNMCHLSKNSYPYVIAEKLQLNSFHSVACSGAISYNVIGGSGISKDFNDKKRDNQYNEPSENNSLGDWLPGYQKQVQFVSENQPMLITSSVIGNDLGFDDLLKSCIAPKSCFPTYEDRLEEFKKVDSKLTTLTTLYKKLKKSAPLHAKIYAIGYPQIAKPGGSCGLNVHLDSEELIFASELITRINLLVKTAAAKAGISYGDIEDALHGYRLCEATLGNHAVNGLTAGDDIFHIIGNESYHPTGFGQFLMAQKLLGDTNNFSSSPTTSTSMPELSSSNPALVKAPKTNRSLQKKVSISLDKSVTKKGGKVTTKLSSVQYSLPPNTPLQVTIGGTPAGTITTNNDGDADIEIVLPPDTEEGIHDIEITGPDVTGTPTDYTAPVLVIPDQVISCGGMVAPSNIDSDRDDIDDACDPIISLPPPSFTTQATPLSTTSLTPPSPTSLVAPSVIGISEQSPVASTATQTPVNTQSFSTPSTKTVDEEILLESNNITEAHSPVGQIALESKELFITQYKRRPLLIIGAGLLLAACIFYLLLRPRKEIQPSEIYSSPAKHYFTF